MKYALILLAIICAIGCKKKKTDINDYPHMTSQQIWDSIGFKYERKYLIYDHVNTHPYGAMIIHSDKSISEFTDLDTITYKHPLRPRFWKRPASEKTIKNFAPFLSKKSNDTAKLLAFIIGY